MLRSVAILRVWPSVRPSVGLHRGVSQHFMSCILPCSPSIQGLQTRNLSVSLYFFIFREKLQILWEKRIRFARLKAQTRCTFVLLQVQKNAAVAAVPPRNQTLLSRAEKRNQTLVISLLTERLICIFLWIIIENNPIHIESSRARLQLDRSSKIC